LACSSIQNLVLKKEDTLLKKKSFLERSIGTPH
jgi:hypothetical protein